MGYVTEITVRAEVNRRAISPCYGCGVARFVIVFVILIGVRVLIAADGGGVAFFEAKIRPLLIEKCYDCHTEGKKSKGGLSLDYRAAVLRGGESGPVIVPGNPDKSPLIEAVRYKNRDLQMPPKGALSEAQIHDLETWVKMGAPDPREVIPAVSGKRVINIEEGRTFWSFKPLSNPAVPPVKNAAWVKTQLDAFLLAELENANLKPAPLADKRTLIRRTTFDLTGLPPSPSEIDAFLNDASPEAFAKVVDRLLASTQYGERWGRHWLDVARYADSNGMDENVAFGNAWRYRDYVVKAFNSDKPFNQFLIEQVAGDLLPANEQSTRDESLTATGFLALGARVLAEPDVRKMEMDIIDEQIDTTGKAFLGMTLGCCRCHDHKFDPIPTTDYYALAAIFRSTRSLSPDKMGAVKFWYEHSLATPEQVEAKKKHEALVKTEQAKVTKFNADLRTKLKTELHDAAADYLAAAAELPNDPDFAKVTALAAERKLRPRYLLTCRQYLTRHPEHPVFAEWRELVKAGKFDAIRAHYSTLFKAADEAMKTAKSLAEKEAKTKAVPAVTKPSDTKSAPVKPAATPAPTAKVPEVKPADPALAAAYDALQDVAGFLSIPDKDANAFDADMLAAAENMKTALMALEAQTPDLPSLMGVVDGTIVKTLPVHIRGSYLTLGKEVERGFPDVMRTSSVPAIFQNKQSGRLELARWMASSDHPLTARVMVNRIWRWHFGRGIVASTDNFGLLGDKPTHPALLDWLARRFIEEGWSVKAMHRLMLNSNTYQMASTQTPSTPDPNLVDPENKLLWRAPVQRLEAEEIRDAMLAVSNSLDLKMGGKTIPLKNRDYIFNHTSKDRTTYETTRRALYIPIIRNHLYDILEQFDYPDPTMPTGSRNATGVAPQALIMMNAPFVMDSAGKLAAKTLEQTTSDDARVKQLYVLLFGRPATDLEIKRALDFVSHQAERSPTHDRKEAWKLLCHTLLATNEFLYIR